MWVVGYYRIITLHDTFYYYTIILIHYSYLSAWLGDLLLIVVD